MIAGDFDLSGAVNGQRCAALHAFDCAVQRFIHREILLTALASDLRLVRRNERRIGIRDSQRRGTGRTLDRLAGKTNWRGENDSTLTSRDDRKLRFGSLLFLSEQITFNDVRGGRRFWSQLVGRGGGLAIAPWQRFGADGIGA